MQLVDIPPGKTENQLIWNLQSPQSHCMKRAHFLLLATIFCCSLACSKSKDSTPAFDPKNTLWSGVYHYTSGGYVGPLEFTLQLNADNSVQWTDITSSRAGGTWKYDGQNITITLPNSTTLSAKITKDSWTGFDNNSALGFAVDRLNATTAIDLGKLVGTKWFGKIGTSVFSLDFKTSSTLEYVYGTSTEKATYAVSGGGIRINQTTIAPLPDKFFGCNDSYSGGIAGNSSHTSISLTPPFTSTTTLQAFSVTK